MVTTVPVLILSSSAIGTCVGAGDALDLVAKLVETSGSLDGGSVRGVSASGCSRGSAAATAAGPTPATAAATACSNAERRGRGGEDLGNIRRKGGADHAQRGRGEPDEHDGVVIVDPQRVGVEAAMHGVTSLQGIHDRPHRLQQLRRAARRLELAERHSRSARRTPSSSHSAGTRRPPPGGQSGLRRSGPSTRTGPRARPPSAAIGTAGPGRCRGTALLGTPAQGGGRPTSRD